MAKRKPTTSSRKTKVSSAAAQKAARSGDLMRLSDLIAAKRLVDRIGLKTARKALEALARLE